MDHTYSDDILQQQKTYLVFVKRVFFCWPFGSVLASAQSFQPLVPLKIASNHSVQLPVPLGLASTQPIMFLVPLGLAKTRSFQPLVPCEVREDKVAWALRSIGTGYFNQNDWYSRVTAVSSEQWAVSSNWVPMSGYGEYATKPTYRRLLGLSYQTPTSNCRI